MVARDMGIWGEEGEVVLGGMDTRYCCEGGGGDWGKNIRKGHGGGYIKGLTMVRVCERGVGIARLEKTMRNGE